MFITSRLVYTLLTTLLTTLMFLGCDNTPTPLPTEDLIESIETLSPEYQLIYHTQSTSTPDPNQQRVRVFLWLNRLNCNISQLQTLDELRQVATNKINQLNSIEDNNTRRSQEAFTPIYNQLWDQLRQGVSIDDESLKPLFESLNTLVQSDQESPQLDPRIETIKSIIEAEAVFLRSLSPEQESTIVDALYFLRYQLDPIGTPQDFAHLIGNTFEPGQYAILLKGTSELAQQSGNIGGLWSDEPELTGRVLHEAQREVVLYLALLEPSLEEAIRTSIALQTQSNTP